jgi:HEAT repeat protein
MRATFASRLASALARNASREQAEEDRRFLLGAGIDSERSMMAATAASDTAPRVLTIISWLLARWPGPRGRAKFVRAACELLRHPRPEVRQEAAVSLGILGTRSAIDSLRGAVRDRDEEVRKRVISGLALQEDDEAAYRTVVAVLTDEKEVSAVRAHAAEALANFGERTETSHLIEALSDPAPEVRFFAAHALGELRALDAVSVLQTVSRSENGLVPGFGTVRGAAKLALRKISGRA